MGKQYSIQFTNNSTNEWNACVFQQDQQINNPGIMSLAWFAELCNPNTKCTFTWTLDYSFVWSETGMLVPGVTFGASEVLPVSSLASGNQVTLDNNGAFLFSNQATCTPGGSLYISQTNNIPLNMGSVGIGMSGAGTFVVQAQPNIDLTFTPHPEYWMAFGQYTTGQVLNTQEMTNTVQVTFPPNIYTMYVTLDAGNNWTVSQFPG